MATLELRQTGIGLVQSIAAGAHDFKAKHFDWHAFAESVELAIGASMTPEVAQAMRPGPARNPFWGREYEGSQVSALRSQLNAGVGEGGDDYMVFRVVQKRAEALGRRSGYVDTAELGQHNELLVAVGRDDVLAAGLIDREVHTGRIVATADELGQGGLDAFLKRVWGKDSGSFSFKYRTRLAPHEQYGLDAGAFANPPPVGRVTKVFNHSASYAQSILLLAAKSNL